MFHVTFSYLLSYYVLCMRKTRYKNQARRELHRGPGKPLPRIPITTPFRMRRDRDAEDVEEETWGVVSLHHPTRGLGSVLSSPAGCRKWILCIEVRKKPFGTPFSVFMSDGAPSPQTSRGPGKLPLPPLSTCLIRIHTTYL